MIQRVSRYESMVLRQRTAALGQNVFELFQAGDELVGECFVDEGPEPLGGLELGAVGGLEDKLDALGDDELGAGVPPRLVQHEKDLLVRPRPDATRKVCQDHLESCCVDAGDQEELHPSALRVDEAIDIHPLIAAILEDMRSLTRRRPNTAQYRLEPHPLLVLSPDLHAEASFSR